MARRYRWIWDFPPPQAVTHSIWLPADRFAPLSPSPEFETDFGFEAAALHVLSAETCPNSKTSLLLPHTIPRRRRVCPADRPAAHTTWGRRCRAADRTQQSHIPERAVRHVKGFAPPQGFPQFAAGASSARHGAVPGEPLPWATGHACRRRASSSCCCRAPRPQTSSPLFRKGRHDSSVGVARGIKVVPIPEVQNASLRRVVAPYGRGKPRLLRGGGYHRPTSFWLLSCGPLRPRDAILPAMVCPRGIRMSNPCSSIHRRMTAQFSPVSSTGTPRKHATIGIGAKGKPWSSPSFGSLPPIFPSCAGPHTRMR